MVTMKALLKQSNKSYKHTSHGRELISFEAQLFVAFDKLSTRSDFYNLLALIKNKQTLRHVSALGSRQSLDW